MKLPQVNGVTFAYPPSPLLSQWEEVPSSILCEKSCPFSGDFCECLNILHIPLNITLDIVIIDKGEYSFITVSPESNIIKKF